MMQHRGGTLVAWVDQFNKARYSKNPATGRDISLSTTARAFIPAGSLRGHFAGHPMPNSPYSDEAEHVTDLQDTWMSFTAATKHLVCQHMSFEEVRCPLDLRRKDVEVTPWYPLAIRDVPISATFGFHQAMYGVLQLANNCSAPVLPMLCDITIYYSYWKMLYSYWMQPLPLHHVYGSVCPLFGIWHPYKYCVDHTCSAFLPFMVALEYEGFLQNPAAGQLYAYPSLIVKERLILAICLSIPGIRAHLRSIAGSRTLKDKLLAGLYGLVFQYAPALLCLGIMVRLCSWYHRTPGTGDAARCRLQVSLYLIQKLNPQQRRWLQASFALSTTNVVPIPLFPSCVCLCGGEGGGPVVPVGTGSGRGHQHYQR